jgi:hypothetical protein
MIQEKDLESGGSEYIMLYVGLGMAAIGLVISFVGLGDKGFKTIELRLVGPSLLGCGLFLAFLQVLYCTLPSSCQKCCASKNQAVNDISNDKMMIHDNRKNSCQRNGAAQQLDTLQLSLNREYSVSNSCRYSIPSTFEDNRADFVSRTHKFSEKCVILDSSKLACAQK